MARSSHDRTTPERVAEARRDFRDASRREPDERTWNFDLGTADAAAGENSEARAQLARAAASSDPAISAKALYQIGTLDLQQQRYADAAGALRKSLKLAPEDAAAKRNFEISVRNLTRPPPPKEGGEPEKKPDQKPDRKKDDSEFQKKAGMTRAEAEAMLRSLESEQKQKERVSAREEGKDW